MGLAFSMERYHLKKNEPKKTGTCAYCGKTCKVTEDHIPPQCIFPKPRTTGLIKVPCCEPCRVGWSKDDEEFRRFVWSADGAEQHPSFEKAANSIISSIQRPEANGYASRVMNSMEDLEAYSEADIFLGIKPTMRLDWPRIEGVLKRIVRGLFFLKNKQLIPDDHELIIKSPGEKLGYELNKILFTQIDNICGRTFCYWLHEPEDAKTSSLWLMSFCDSIWVLGYIRPVRRLG